MKDRDDGHKQWARSKADHNTLSCLSLDKHLLPIAGWPIRLLRRPQLRKVALLLGIATSIAVIPQESATAALHTSALQSTSRLDELDLLLEASKTSRGEQIYQRLCKQTARHNQKLEDLDAQLTRSFWDGLPNPVSPQVFNETAAKAIQRAEDNVFELIRIERDEVRRVFQDAKAFAIAHIDSSEANKLFPLNSITPTSREEAKRKIRRTELVYGREWVEAVVSSELKKADQSKSENMIRADAFQQYQRICGVNGLSRQSGFYGDVDGRILVVLCPGLIIGTDDVLPWFTDKKSTVVSATSSVFGDINAHIIARSFSADQAVNASFAKLSESLGENGAIKLINQFYGYWAAASLVNEIGRFPRREFREKTITNALSSQCNRGDDGLFFRSIVDHPALLEEASWGE